MLVWSSRSHRVVLSAATLGVAACAVALTWPGGPAVAGGAGSNCPVSAPVMATGGLANPPELRSVGGELSIELRASSGAARLGAGRATGLLYNRGLPAPTIRVCAGDTLKVRFVNDLDEHTNLHLHGLHVSPSGIGDNIFRDIAPGTTVNYEYEIPRSHEPGTDWYHPHMHGLTDQQVFEGLAGAMIVEHPELDDLPSIAGLPQRVMLLQAVQKAHGRIIDADKSTAAGRRVYVNGRLNPTITMRPGELQRWRMINASADQFLRLRMPHTKLQVIGDDGNPLERRMPVDEILMSPGERREILVRGPAEGRQLRLRTRFFRQPFVNTQAQVLTTVVGVGDPVARRPLPGRLVPFTDLSGERVDRRRTVVFRSNFPEFTVNGKLFDHMRTDAEVHRGALEEWTVRNRSGEWHNFHIHQNPFQVVAIDGRAVRRRYYQDTVAIAPWATVTLRSRFADFTGEYVFHCHLLEHEDGGMMGTVRVTP